MSTDFTPTHRTNRAIGNIKSGSPIRVAKYDDPGSFIYLLEKLGAEYDHIEYRYDEQDVQFWDSRVRTGSSRYVLPDDYVITDGEHFEVSYTDSGWDLLPTRKVSGTEKVNISFHETYYCLYGAETDTVLRLTPDHLRALASKIAEVLSDDSPEGVSFIAWGDDLYTLRGDTGAEIKVAAEQLHKLVQIIKERVPEPSPIEDAQFITAFNQNKGEYQVLAKFDDVWYDDNGIQHTDQQVLEDYDEIEVIK